MLRINSFLTTPLHAHRTELKVAVHAEYEQRSREGRYSDRKYPNSVDSANLSSDRRKSQRREVAPPSKKGGRPVDDIPIARLDNFDNANFYTSKSWAELGTHPAMIEALANIGITRPSHVQAAAFRAATSNARNLVVADYAGSGKTLAYLVPLIQKLKDEEEAARGPTTTPNAPRIIVVVPTAELCSQVLRVCRGISSTLRFRTGAANGGRPIRTQKELLQGGVDLLVGTPGRLAELLASGDLSFSKCLGMVLDEADILLAEAAQFKEQVLPLQAAMFKESGNGQTLFVTATIPAEMYAEIEENNPGLVVAMGPRLHRLAPGVTEQLIDCSGGDEVNEETGFRRKAAALLASLQEHKAPRTIVFCNKIENCRKVENFLNRNLETVLNPTTNNDSDSDNYRDNNSGGGRYRNDNTYKPQGWKIMPFHAGITAERRSADLTQFLLTPKPSDPPIIMVCTDRASRGVDSTFVDHVVLFDFPRDPSEYVRRVGRTGRGAGGQGAITVLALGRQVKLAKNIMGQNEKGRPIHSVPSVLPGYQLKEE